MEIKCNYCSSLIKYFNYYLQLYIAIWQGRCLKRIQNKSFLFLLILSRVRRSVKPFFIYQAIYQCKYKRWVDTKTYHSPEKLYKKKIYSDMQSKKSKSSNSEYI